MTSYMQLGQPQPGQASPNGLNPGQNPGQRPTNYMQGGGQSNPFQNWFAQQRADYAGGRQAGPAQPPPPGTQFGYRGSGQFLGGQSFQPNQNYMRPGQPPPFEQSMSSMRGMLGAPQPGQPQPNQNYMQGGVQGNPFQQFDQQRAAYAGGRQAGPAQPPAPGTQFGYRGSGQFLGGQQPQQPNNYMNGPAAQSSAGMFNNFMRRPGT